MHREVGLFFLALCLSALACTLADVEVTVMSERTTLENQVLGTYNSLDREMLLVASVRGVDSSGRVQEAPRRSGEHKDAITAMQVTAFHEDDVNAFKRLGWVGENNRGLLTQFEMTKDNIPQGMDDFVERYTEDEFSAVVFQVNQARETIMRRVIDMNENMSESDLPEVHRIFGAMNIENALPGEKIEARDGKWVVKE